MANEYATLITAKQRLNIDSDGYDTQLAQLLTTASRVLDECCLRHFYVRVGTRTQDPRHSWEVALDDDLLSLTSLQTDEDGDRTYETTWDASRDYYLGPANALVDGEPYDTIEVDQVNGRYCFPVRPRSTRTVGLWGYSQATEAVSSLLNEELDASETGVDVVSGTAYQAGQTLLLDTEQIYVVSISTNTLPDDGEETPPDVGNRKPSYQTAVWPALIRNATGLPMALECHQTLAPDGTCGWVLYLRFSKAGKTYEWAEGHGSAEWLGHPWGDVTPVPLP